MSTVLTPLNMIFKIILFIANAFYRTCGQNCKRTANMAQSVAKCAKP